MPKGRPGNRLTRQERIRTCHERMFMGFSNADIAREMNLHPDTVARYRKLFSEKITNEAQTNPQLLSDVLANTIRSLEELELIRKDVWRQLTVKRPEVFFCGECDTPNEIDVEVSSVERATLLGTLLRAQKQRAELYGLLGVKAEVYAHVAQVSKVQQAVLQFMQRELCSDDRAKLDEYLTRALGTDAVLIELPAPPVEEIIDVPA